jgi:hypothetical protein
VCCHRRGMQSEGWWWLSIRTSLDSVLNVMGIQIQQAECEAQHPYIECPVDVSRFCPCYHVSYFQHHVLRFN